MDVDNSELSWLSNYLAHGITTHKSFYRQHDVTLELAKVSKLLLVAESGNLGKLKEKSFKILIWMVKYVCVSQKYI